jgi:ribonuclease Z
MIDVSLPGTGGMMPLPGRYLASMICRMNGRMLLVDCGEGMQCSLKLLGWGFKNIDAICITHFHADHISGLPGLLLTIGNAGRTEPLNMLGPEGLRRVVKSLCVIAPELPFEIIFHEAPRELRISGFNIKALELAHRISCYAYSFGLPRIGRFDIDRATALGLPKTLWSYLQKSGTAVWEGREYTADMVLGEPRKGIKISYCTDTRPVAALEDFVQGSDLFVCEGMYGDDGLREKAIRYRHMVFSEAAEIAKSANVKELWLTHFSPSMTEPMVFLPVAADIFPNTKIARDRMTKTFMFEDQGAFS